jgi:predicted acetylornithine/succinylornithine family transaminase
MKLTLDDIRAGESRHVLQTYRRQPVAFVRGSGAHLFDVDGRDYLDFVSGIGVTSLGHAHPGLTAAIADQAATLVHTSNLYYHPFQLEAASRLAQLSGLARTFFCNSGTEAVEACLKFARRYWYTQGATRRTAFVALEGGFSGRTFGALSVTHDEHYRAPFAPLLESVTFVDPRAPEALAAAVSERTAAIIAEPIQGEGGIRPLSPEFARAINDVCARTGTLYIADEVQSGLGRTGHAFYSHALGLRPDLMSVGKALGGGVPVGAALLSERIAQAVSPGDHGSTYGGNLLGTRAAAFVLDQLITHGLLDHVNEVGLHFERRLRTLALRHPVVVEVRGAGLMRGLQLASDATPVIDLARDRGLLVNRTDEKVVRLLPPLTIQAGEIDRAVEILDGVLTAVSSAAPACAAGAAEGPATRGEGGQR